MKLPFPLQPSEQVVLVTRRHWVFFVPRFIAYALGALVPIGVLLVVLRVTDNLHGKTALVAGLICLLWLLFWLARLALLKYRYDRDLWVITNQRVVDLVATSPFNFHMSTAALVDLEDVSTSIDGVLQSTFNYGNLECQTAGEMRHFSFRGVPDPRRIAAVLEHESLVAKGRMPPASQDAPTERQR
ncbi:MAG TPA: hypothetical protein VKV26_10760 [Dehalococcoidia bacterium]|nr:hypothetical protein [Dehalococcoidia bacterium]